ncbi:MAG: DUF4295 domain-containing protein [Bacteroidia bacterium]
MAKKVVASLQKAGSKDFTKVIKLIKSPKTGAFAFRSEVVPNDKVAEFLAAK